MSTVGQLGGSVIWGRESGCDTRRPLGYIGVLALSVVSPLGGNVAFFSLSQQASSAIPMSSDAPLSSADVVF